MTGMFIPLRKVDEATRRVFASVDETPDHAREAMVYALARPQFEKWSGAQQEASGGKSYGNVREMHAKSAAGIVCEPLAFDEVQKSIGFWIEVVDDQAWEKVCRGVYTGVSPGGGYGKTFRKDGVRYYEPLVAELSLVDKPCIPTATFQFAKADGSVEEREFVEFNPGRDEVRGLAAELAKAAGKPDRVSDYVMSARADLIKRHADVWAPVDDPPPADPAADDEMAKLQAALDDADALLKAKPKPYGDVDYADPKAGKYPIDTAAHIRAAWSYVNMAKNAAKLDDVDAVKAKIVAAWKAKIDSAGPPSMEKAAFLAGLIKSGAAAALLTAMADVAMEKGFYTITRTSALLSQLAGIADEIIWEERYENDDDSTLPQGVCDLMARTKSFLIDQLNEETAEFFAAAEANGGDGIALLSPVFGENGLVLELAAAATDLQKLHKADAELMEKVGKRMSAKDGKHVQAMHDHSTQLGARCDSGNTGEAEKMAKLALESGELTKARRMLAAATPAIAGLSKSLREAQDELGGVKAEVAGLRGQVAALAAGPGLAKGVLLTLDKGDDGPTPAPPGTKIDPNGPPPADPVDRREWALMRKFGQGGGLPRGIPAPGGGY